MEKETSAAILCGGLEYVMCLSLARGIKTQVVIVHRHVSLRTRWRDHDGVCAPADEVVRGGRRAD